MQIYVNINLYILKMDASYFIYVNISYIKSRNKLFLILLYLVKFSSLLLQPPAMSLLSLVHQLPFIVQASSRYIN